MGLLVKNYVSIQILMSIGANLGRNTSQLFFVVFHWFTGLGPFQGLYAKK